jgi:hypothetical protein
MIRSRTVLMLGGLLVGCGGMPEENAPEESTPVEMQESRLLDVAPPPVSEGEVSQSRVTTIVIYGASISYNSVNDAFTVRDTLADGRAAVAVVYNHRTGTTKSCWNPYGPGTTGVCDRNYPGNPVLSISACTGDFATGTLLACSGWVAVNAFAPATK